MDSTPQFSLHNSFVRIQPLNFPYTIPLFFPYDDPSIQRTEKGRSYDLKFSKEFEMRFELMLEFLQNIEETFLSSKIPMMIPQSKGHI
jgi:hypothetical protein